LDASLDRLVHFTSPRAWAFAVLGLQEYLNQFPGDRVARETRERLARRLLELHRAHATKDWYWFEDTVAFDNATLPHGLLAAGAGISEPDMIQLDLVPCGGSPRLRQLVIISLQLALTASFGAAAKEHGLTSSPSRRIQSWLRPWRPGGLHKTVTG
jgi:hypothetical protein